MLPCGTGFSPALPAGSFVPGLAEAFPQSAVSSCGVCPPVCTCHKTLVLNTTSLGWELMGALPRACPVPPDAEHSCTAPAPAMSVGHPLVSAHDLEALGCGTHEACKGGCGHGSCCREGPPLWWGTARMGDQADKLVPDVIKLVACMHVSSLRFHFVQVAKAPPHP